MPVPQLLQLPGHVQNILKENVKLKQQLESVEYSSRYALGAFYKNCVDLGLSYDAKYISDDDIIRFKTGGIRQDRIMMITLSSFGSSDGLTS